MVEAINEAASGATAGGENGATFTPSVSAAGVLSWSNDRGLKNPAPVNVLGPRGEKGETGAQGPQGEKGESGLEGKSAYAYALDGGFAGTELEFAQRLAKDSYSKSEIDSIMGSYITDINTLIGGNG